MPTTDKIACPSQSGVTTPSSSTQVVISLVKSKNNNLFILSKLDNTKMSKNSKVNSSNQGNLN